MGVETPCFRRGSYSLIRAARPGPIMRCVARHQPPADRRWHSAHALPAMRLPQDLLEWVTAAQAVDIAHPAFSKLFIETEYLPDARNFQRFRLKITEVFGAAFFKTLRKHRLFCKKGGTRKNFYEFIRGGCFETAFLSPFENNSQECSFGGHTEFSRCAAIARRSACPARRLPPMVSRRTSPVLVKASTRPMMIAASPCRRE